MKSQPHANKPLRSAERGSWANSVVFIDANIFIYGLSGQSGQCRQLLERCLREEVTGITLFETINEVTHRLMVAEALAKGLIGGGGAKALRHNLRIIPSLRDYWRNTERLLALNLVLMPADEAIVRGAQAERQSAALLTNDSIIVSCMREYSLSSLASNDADFERVAGITVFRPTDLL
jgi:predicted nucleic acid-binding protein